MLGLLLLPRSNFINHDCQAFLFFFFPFRSAKTRDRWSRFPQTHLFDFRQRLSSLQPPNGTQNMTSYDCRFKSPAGAQLGWRVCVLSLDMGSIIWTPCGFPAGWKSKRKEEEKCWTAITAAIILPQWGGISVTLGYKRFHFFSLFLVNANHLHIFPLFLHLMILLHPFRTFTLFGERTNYLTNAYLQSLFLMSFKFQSMSGLCYTPCLFSRIPSFFFFFCTVYAFARVNWFCFLSHLVLRSWSMVFTSVKHNCRIKQI